MVQGLPAVKWTTENNQKLFAAIVYLYSGAFDAKKLASVFGPNVPVDALRYRLGCLRKEGAALGITSDGAAPKLVSKPVRRAANGAAKNGKGRKRVGGMLSDAPSDDESVDMKDETEEEVTTPAKSNLTTTSTTTPNPSSDKTIGGRVTKPGRISPRKTTKKDYKAMMDPFKDIEAANGKGEDRIFDTEKSSSEDTYASDGEYVKPADGSVPVKTEQAY